MIDDDEVDRWMAQHPVYDPAEDASSTFSEVFWGIVCGGFVLFILIMVLLWLF